MPLLSKGIFIALVLSLGCNQILGFDDYNIAKDSVGNADTNQDTNTDTDIGTDTDTDADTDTYTDSDTTVDTDTDSNTESDTNSDGDTEYATGTGADTDSATGTDRDTDSATGTEWDTGTATDADSDSVSPSDTDTGTEISCGPGTGNCNNDPSDGCEINLTSHSAHCGACWHDCLGGICQASACQPVAVTVPMGSSVTPRNGCLALDATRVYVSYEAANAGGVSMVMKDGTNPTCVACDQGQPRDIVTDGTHVYWTDRGMGALYSAPLGTNTPGTLVTGSVGTPLAVHGSHLYWYDEGYHEVMQADLDGGNPTPLAANQVGVTSIAADDGFAYWTVGSDVMILDLAGGSPTPLAQSQPDARSVALDTTHVYWAEGPWGGNESIWRILKTGGQVELVASGDAYAIALDDTYVYSAGSADNTIWRAPKIGGNPEILATNQDFPFDIAVDDVAVYWTSETDGSLSKVAK